MLILHRRESEIEHTEWVKVYGHISNDQLMSERGDRQCVHKHQFDGFEVLVNSWHAHSAHDLVVWRRCCFLATSGSPTVFLDLVLHILIP